MNNYIVNFKTWATLNESGKWIKDALPNNAANKLNEQDSISPMEGDSIFIVGFVSEGGIIVNAYCSEGVINKVDESGERFEVTLKEASDLGGIKDIMESSVIINKKDIITDPRGIGSTTTWAAVTDNLNF